jgi:hypothetical protein
VTTDDRSKVLSAEAAALVTVSGMAEVGMAVQVYQPEPAALRKGEPNADQQAAVTAEDEHPFVAIDACPNPFG